MSELLHYCDAAMATSKAHTRADRAVPAQAEAQTALLGLDQRYRTALMAFFLRRVVDPSEAEDLTQEVFVGLAASRQGATSNVDGYVFQIAANLLRDRARRENVRSAHRAHMIQNAKAQVESLGPLPVSVGRQALDEVVLALEELPPKTRAIFLLFRLERIKQEQIARVYGISVSAVQKHLLRAMAHLTARVQAHR